MYLFISAMLSASSFAQTAPLLQLDQYSGYTTPEAAMEAHCSLVPYVDSSTANLSAHVVSKISRGRDNGGWHTESNADNAISDADFTQVLAWIKDAEAGPFKQGANPCDIGTVTIVTQNFPLLISKDCGKRIENQNPAAAKLIAWFRQACTLDGVKR